MDGLIRYIDLNADVGEGVATEALIIPYLSSCNVACGGHYGDKQSIIKTLNLAKKHGVKVGAHPAYPDKAFFGRRVLDINATALKTSLKEQISLFLDCCAELGMQINHVKPHGALYNEAASNKEVARVVLEALQELGLNLPVYTLPKGQLEHLAAGRFEIIPEAFTDRRYMTDGSLVSRKIEGSVINKPEPAWEQLKELVLNDQVLSLEGIPVEIKAQTYCVHGDTPNALEILQYIDNQLAAHQIALKR